MGIALTDVLVELSSPKTQIEFKRNPKAFLDSRSLAEDEKSALMNGLGPHLAQSAAPELRVEGRAAKLLVEERAAKLLVETDASNAGGVGGFDRIFVDEGGRFFRMEAI